MPAWGPSCAARAVRHRARRSSPRLADGRVEIEVGAPTHDYLAQHLAGWGDGLEVVEPDEVREQLRAASAASSSTATATHAMTRRHSVRLSHPGLPAAAEWTVPMTVPDRFDDVSDAVLALAIARYDQAALAEAYRRHAGAVFGLARRLLVEPALAEEIVQEVFLRLWNDPARFDPERGTMRSYLLTQTHGRSVDLLRADISRRGREERDARRTAEGGHRHRARGVGPDDRRARPRLARHAARPTSARRSSWPTAAGTRTARWPPASTQPEGTIKSRIRSGLHRLRRDLTGAGITTGGPCVTATISATSRWTSCSAPTRSTPSTTPSGARSRRTWRRTRAPAPRSRAHREVAALLGVQQRAPARGAVGPHRRRAGRAAAGARPAPGSR